jgi:RNA polymerase sigma factor (sigma-70 family)
MSSSKVQQVFGPQSIVPTAREPVSGGRQKFGAEDLLRLRRILGEPIEYIAHASFGDARTVRSLYGANVGAEKATRPWCNAADIDWEATGLTASATTLSGDEEQRLFLRLNYARYRIQRLLIAFGGKRLTLRAATEILWWHAQVETTRTQIVQANVPLVLAMAKRTRLGNIDYAELISEGNMALLRSVDKFDCGRGFKFSTYACRAILKSFSRVAMRTSRYRSQFPTEFDPTLERSDHTERQRLAVEADCVDELKTILGKNLAQLNEVEVKVLKARFALEKVDGMPEPSPQTLEQVGVMIGVTKERVRQIQNRALAKLRLALQDDFLAA